MPGQQSYQLLRQWPIPLDRQETRALTCKELNTQSRQSEIKGNCFATASCPGSFLVNGRLYKASSHRTAMKLTIIAIAATLLSFTTFAFADAQRGTLVHEETIRVAPNADAARVGDAGRGHELIILDTSRDWV